MVGFLFIVIFLLFVICFWFGALQVVDLWPLPCVASQTDVVRIKNVIKIVAVDVLGAR